MTNLTTQDPGTSEATTLESNKALVRRVIEEVFLKGSSDAVDELLGDDFVGHGGGPDMHGREGMKETIGRVSKGLADATITIDDMIAEGDRVAARVTSHAVQVGPFMGLPPSGRSYTIGEIHIFRIRDGAVVEHWHEADFLGMMRQLGALPG